MAPRMTYPTACVLEALSRGVRYGFDIMDLTGLPSGTVYPILRRLEAHGMVVSEWEEGDLEGDARPRRCYYDLTDLGREGLAAAHRKLVRHRGIYGALEGEAAADG